MSPRRQDLRTAALLSLLLLGAAAATVEGQTLPLMAGIQLGRERVFVGERFVVRVRVVGTVRPDEPDVSAIRDFDVEHLGRRGNSTQRETVFHYMLRARRAGMLEIPPIGVSGGGAKTKTAPARVEVRLPENPGSFRLRVEPERITGYVGQQIVVNFAFECDAEVKSIQFDAPFLRDERFVALMDTVRFRGRLPDGYERVPVNRGLMVARREPSAEKGRELLRFAAVVIPQRVGRILLQAASAVATIPSLPNGAAARGAKVVLTSPTGEIRDDTEQRGFVYSEPAELQVHELPRQDVPSTFSGLVGLYEVTAETVPPAITFGDPLELVVSLSGQPYLAEATIPDLRNTAGLLADFEVQRAAEFTSLERSRKVFRYALRPKRSGDLAIPPLPYSYFDPDSGRYVSTHSEPLQIEVQENRVLTAADAEGPAVAKLDPLESNAATDSSGPNNESTSDNGAKPPMPAEPVTVASLLSSVARTLQSPLVVGGLLTPPLVLLVVWLAARFAKVRKSRIAQPATPSPFEQFETDFTARIPGEASDATAQAAAVALFREFVGRRFELPGSSMTFRDLAPRLEERGVSPHSITRVENLFATQDAARYGAGPSGSAEFAPSEVRNLAREIEDELRRLDAKL